MCGDYEYHNGFLDIDGWDIAHLRRVSWLWSSLDKPRVFDTYTLNQGDTTQLLPNTDKTFALRQWIEEFPLEIKGGDVTLPVLPKSSDLTLSLGDACNSLYDSGLSSKSISHRWSQISDLAELARWYERHADQVSEAETVTHLIVPLLSALGWSPQSLAVEWPITGTGTADLVAFRPLRGRLRTDADISVLVEAKRLGTSCLTAVDQARRYAAKMENCLRLVVTDGMRYAIFVRASNNKGFGNTPVAYLNLLEPRKSYPILCCEGAGEALVSLSSAWHLGSIEGPGS